MRLANLENIVTHCKDSEQLEEDRLAPTQVSNWTTKPTTSTHLFSNQNNRVLKWIRIAVRHSQLTSTSIPPHFLKDFFGSRNQWWTDSRRRRQNLGSRAFRELLPQSLKIQTSDRTLNKVNLDLVSDLECFSLFRRATSCCCCGVD